MPLDVFSLYLQSWANSTEVKQLINRDSCISWGEIEVRQDSCKCQGFFLELEDNVNAAIFAICDQLYFAVGSRSWDWGQDKLKVKLLRKFEAGVCNSVKVHSIWRIVYSLQYLSHGGGSLPGGAFHDVIDDEMADWWVWLDGNFSSTASRKNFAKRWTIGF